MNRMRSWTRNRAIKKNLELKNTVTVKNSIEIFNSILDQAEEKNQQANMKIDHLKFSSQSRKKNEKEWEKSLYELWDTIKRNNLLIIVVLEGEEKEEGQNAYLKKNTGENFPNLVWHLGIQVHNTHGTQKVSNQNNLLQDTL